MTIKKRVVHDMLEYGMPQGKRVYQEYDLPCWVLNGSDDIKLSFLSGYYAADGMIPSLQSNDETPRPLSFCFYKATYLQKSGDSLAEQYRSIVSDLGFKTTLAVTNVYTGTLMNVYTITIYNQREQYLKLLEMLDLSYCIPREQRRKQIISYLSLKKAELNKMKQNKEIALTMYSQGYTIQQIAKIMKIVPSRIQRLISGKNKCRRLVGFPKFEDFLRTYSPIKTPLNEETPVEDNLVPSLDSDI